MQNLKEISKSKIYNNAISRKCEKTTSERKWRRLFAHENLNFAKAYDVKIMNMRERRSAEFNYKVLQMTLACGFNLKKWQLAEDDLCVMCGIQEDIVHMLKEYVYSHNIWDSVQGALKTTISSQDIITGKGNPTLDETITTIAYISTTTHYYDETKD